MSSQEEAAKLVKIIRPYDVPTLYKYRSMEAKGLEDIFQQKKIYLNDVTQFNDPFDCRPSLTAHESSLKRNQYLKESLKSRFPKIDKRQLQKLMKAVKPKSTDGEVLRSTYDNFLNTVGIYCLSEKKDNLLMWSYYSDAHRGLCLEFDSAHKNTLFWEAFKVEYQEDYPVVNIMDIGKSDMFQKALLTKSSHWKHEQEWRILKTHSAGGPGHYEFAPELLTGIIFGALMTAEHKKTISDWLSRFPKKVTIYQASLNSSRYSLDITPQ